MDIKDALDFYRIFVERIISEKRPIPMDNSSLDHAIILIEELIGTAKRTVDIYCKALSPDVWASFDVVCAVQQAIKSKVKFRIVTKDDPSSSETLSLLQNYPFASFRKYVNKDLKANFLIIDNTAFRVEPDETKREGFAYANNKQMAEDIVDSFSKIWNVAK